ncbi:hypothetical protein ABIE91_000973 [Bradyrhizobium elkanii]
MSKFIDDLGVSDQLSRIATVAACGTFMFQLSLQSRLDGACEHVKQLLGTQVGTADCA